MRRPRRRTRSQPKKTKYSNPKNMSVLSAAKDLLRRVRSRIKSSGRPVHRAFAMSGKYATNSPPHRQPLLRHPPQATPSAASANNAAGTAPASTNPLSTLATPRNINSPKPPAPIAAAIVATPTQVTVAVRNPAKMTLAASGKFHFNQSLPSRSFPKHSTTSISAASTLKIPAYVFRRIGSSAYPVNATIANRAAAFSPSHGTGSSKPKQRQARNHLQDIRHRQSPASQASVHTESAILPKAVSQSPPQTASQTRSAIGAQTSAEPISAPMLPARTPSSLHFPAAFAAESPRRPVRLTGSPPPTAPTRRIAPTYFLTASFPLPITSPTAISATTTPPSSSTTRSAKNSASSRSCVTHQHSLPHPPQQPLQHLLHLHPRQRIERSKRLIHQQNLRIRCQRPCKPRPFAAAPHSTATASAPPNPHSTPPAPAPPPPARPPASPQAPAPSPHFARSSYAETAPHPGSHTQSPAAAQSNPTLSFASPAPSPTPPSAYPTHLPSAAASSCPTRSAPAAQSSSPPPASATRPATTSVHPPA